MIRKAILIFGATALAASLAFAGCGPKKGGDTGDKAADKGLTIPADFRDWGALNAEVFVSAGHGGDKFVVNDYVSADAKELFLAKGAGPYPVGAMLIKEHFMNEGGSAGAAGPLMGMVKRAAGFDAEHGDWEYFQASADGTVSASGPLPGCITCHAEVAAQDWVYGLPDAPTADDSGDSGDSME